MTLTPGITVYIAIVAFALGAVFGSFLNCMAWRIVHHESVLKGRSHCASCGHPLGAADLVPIVSYAVLGGKCRYCKKKIVPRYVLAEVVSGTAFVVCFLRFGISFRTLQLIVLFCILLALSLVDLESYEIPDRFIAAGIVWWAATSWLTDRRLNLAGLTVERFAAGQRLTLPQWGWNALAGCIGGLAIGGGMLLLSLLFDRILGKESLGGGDIKLFFMTGLYLGAALGLFNLILSCILGLFVAVGMKQKRIPFGPAISAAAFISLLIGEQFVSWYLALLG